MPRADADFLRTTSAGYRFPGAAVSKISERHEKCIPLEIRQRRQIEASENATRPKGDRAPAGRPPLIAANLSAIDEGKIWSETIETEKKCIKDWEKNWSFLLDYDLMGREQPRPLPPPSTVNMFSSGTVPNTNSGNYGAQLKKNCGQRIQDLEFQFYSHRRKLKLDKEFIQSY